MDQGCVQLPIVQGQALRIWVDAPDAHGATALPRDPLTGKYEWGMRSDQDDPKSMSWGGQNVFDVYTKSTDMGPDGKPYAEW